MLKQLTLVCLHFFLRLFINVHCSWISSESDKELGGTHRVQTHAVLLLSVKCAST